MKKGFDEAVVRAALDEAWSLETAMEGIPQREYDALRLALTEQLQ